MKDDNLENFFDILLTEENEQKILRLISKGLNEDEILEILLNGESGGENP